MIVCIDVDYKESQAHVACLVFKNIKDAVPDRVYTILVNDIHDYIPGEFYKRELPCILKVLEIVEEKITLIIVDGYVWLDSNRRRGLGAYLYAHLHEKIPVIGVAKNKFKGSDHLGEVLRGESQKPLYVTAAGLELETAMKMIDQMDGEFRFPTLLREVDQQCRDWNNT